MLCFITILNKYHLSFDTKKFAELIIKECANHILNTSDRYRKEYFAGKVMELVK